MRKIKPLMVSYSEYKQPPLSAMTRSGLPVWWLVILFLALALSAEWYTDYASSNTFIKSSVAGIITSSLLALWAWACYWRRPKTVYIYITPGRMWFMALFLLGGLSICWAANIDFAITKWLLWLSAAISFFLVLNIDLSQRNLILLAWGLVAGGSLIAIVGILQHLADGLVALPQAAPPASTFTNKNMAAQVVVLVWPMSLFLLFDQSIKPKGLRLLGLCMALMLVYVFYTAPRAAWLSMLLQWLVIGGYLWVNRSNISQWSQWNPTKTQSLTAAAVLVLLLVNVSAEGFMPFWQVASEEIGSIADSANNTGSARYRIWGVTLEMIKDHPWLGSGLGSWSHNIAADHYGTWDTLPFRRAHNDLLELTTELGVLGLVLFIAVLIVLLTAVTRILRNLSVTDRWFYWLVLVSLSGSALNMMFSFPYQNAVPLVLFSFYAALLIKGSDPYDPAIKTLVLNVKPSQRFATSVVTTLACAMVIVIYAQWIRAYQQIDKISHRIDNNAFTSVHLAALNTSVYHAEIPSLLRAVGKDLEARKKYRGAQVVWDEMLRYSPNNYVPLARSAVGLVTLKQYNKALDRLERVRRAAPVGLYIGTIEAIKIYDRMGKKEQATKLYNSLRQQSEQDLAKQRTAYAFMHQKSVDWQLWKQTVPLYQQYQKYHGRNCTVENNMVAYYLFTNQPETALSMGRELLLKDPECVSSWVADKLQALDSSL